MRVDEHIRELLKLPPDDRALAARLLFESLEDDSDDPDAEALRAAELSHRATAVADGTATLLDADDVRARAAARLVAARKR